MFRMRHLSGWFLRILLWLVLVQTGCSMRKLGYDLAPRYVSQRLASTLALDEPERRQTDRSVRDLAHWHRRTELSRYVVLLSGLSDRFRDGMSPDDFAWLRDQGNQALARLAARFSPDIAPFLAHLSEDQLRHAEAELAKSERERFQKLDQTDEKYFSYRRANTQKLLKTWLGSYTDEQLALFVAFHKQDRDMERARRDASRNSRADLASAIRNKASKEELAQKLYRWVTQRQTTPTQDYQLMEREQEDQYVSLLLNVDRTLSPAQRQHLLSELAAWKSDFAALAAE